MGKYTQEELEIWGKIINLPPDPPRETTLQQRVFTTFYVHRDDFNEQHLRETKGFTGQIWRGRFVAKQDRNTLARFCEQEGWTKHADADIWAGPTGKAKLDGTDIIFILKDPEAKR